MVRCLSGRKNNSISIDTNFATLLIMFKALNNVTEIVGEAVRVSLAAEFVL